MASLLASLLEIPSPPLRFVESGGPFAMTPAGVPASNALK